MEPLLINEDCLEAMKTIESNSIDLVFCDPPYGQTNCTWDTKIDLEKFWKEINRITKETTPIFFTTTTKFGVELIMSNPKNFRYDLVWIKSASAGFLNAKKMPMRKHEMVYVFYRKLPLYDLSSHSHKFITERTGRKGNTYNSNPNSEDLNTVSDELKYDPPLPNSVIKEDGFEYEPSKKIIYGDITIKKYPNTADGKRAKDAPIYDPPLPVSVIKEELCVYDVSKNCYGGGAEGRIKISKNKEDHSIKYDPPLPTSVITTKLQENVDGLYGIETKKVRIYENGILQNETRYEPPLPNSVLEIKSQKGKHATQKPIALMEWILKYYSKEGDTVLDPTMGSGSTGIACKNMNRKFIGIELNKEIFDAAKKNLGL